MVYRIAYAKMRTKHDADDIFQEVFVRYITNKKPFTCEEHRKAWLIQVTVNCCKKTLSSSWFTKTRPLAETDAAFDMQIEETALYEALMKLPPKYCIVIYLFYYEDMPIEKIASALKKAPGNIRVQLTRARKMLKNYLKGESLHEQA